MECVEKEKFGFDRIDASANNPEAEIPYDREASQYAAKKVLRAR